MLRENSYSEFQRLKQSVYDLDHLSIDIAWWAVWVSQVCKNSNGWYLGTPASCQHSLETLQISQAPGITWDSNGNTENAEKLKCKEQSSLWLPFLQQLMETIFAISHDLKDCQALEEAAQGSSWVTVPGDILRMCRCGIWGYDLVVDLPVMV